MSDEFTKLVERCRKNQDSRLIENAAWSHAQTLFVNLIQAAFERSRVEPIRIVTGSLNKDFYASDKIIDAIATYLSKEGANIEVVVLNSDADLTDHPFVEAVKNSGKGSVIVADANAPLQQVPHFIVVGDRRFRLETDHGQTKAIACFNNKEIGAYLINLYKRVFACINHERIAVSV